MLHANVANKMPIGANIVHNPMWVIAISIVDEEIVAKTKRTNRTL